VEDLCEGLVTQRSDAAARQVCARHAAAVGREDSAQRSVSPDVTLQYSRICSHESQLLPCVGVVA
jgi:hypothetical protein